MKGCSSTGNYKGSLLTARVWCGPALPSHKLLAGYPLTLHLAKSQLRFVWGALASYLRTALLSRRETEPFCWGCSLSLLLRDSWFHVAYEFPLFQGLCWGVTRLLKIPNQKRFTFKTVKLRGCVSLLRALTALSPIGMIAPTCQNITCQSSLHFLPLSGHDFF